jgi:hypothetical protein
VKIDYRGACRPDRDRRLKPRALGQAELLWPVRNSFAIANPLWPDGCPGWHFSHTAIAVASKARRGNSRFFDLAPRNARLDAEQQCGTDRFPFGGPEGNRPCPSSGDAQRDDSRRAGLRSGDCRETDFVGRSHVEGRHCAYDGVSSRLATRRASEEAHQIPCICCALVRSSMTFGPRVRLTVLVRKRGSERLPSIRAIPARVLTDRAATSPATRTSLPL